MKHGGKPWFFRSRLADCCAIPSFDRLRPDDLWSVSAYAAPRPELCNPRSSSAAPRRCAPSCWPAPPSPACGVCGPASVRAMSPWRAPRLLACSTTALLPMISSRLSVRSPMLRDRAELLLAARRVLPGRKPDPGGKVAPLGEGPRWWRERCNRGCRDRADAGDGHQPPGNLILARAAHDLLVEKRRSAGRAPPGSPAAPCTPRARLRDC